MGGPEKGTVMSLSSLFPADEARKAMQRVQDAITERRKQMEQLNDFIADNKSLIDLVQRLPDKLNHDVMVPFGKAAFFPGRLIHTNEFMVLLGESYYAERSSKQTTEILTRRGKALESQAQNLKAVMQDLEAEASFFDTTASESAEGLVEIREEIVEENSYGVSAAGDSGSLSKAENDTQENDDEEYARILARIDELEKEEAEQGSETSEDETDETSLDRSIVHPTMNQHIGSSEDEASNVQAQLKDEYSQGECLPFSPPNSTKIDPRLPIPKDNAVVLERKQEAVSTAPPHFDGAKAFTGSIVERSPNFEMQPREQIVGRSSKPLSRFKMQRK